MMRVKMDIRVRCNRFTEEELSKYWQIKRGTLQKWRSLGIGPIYIKIGGKVFYRVEAIVEFEKSRTFRSPFESAQSAGGEYEEK